MPRSFPGGSFRRRINHYGESVTLLNETVSADNSTDWDDESVATETVSPVAYVQIPGRSSTMSRDARSAELNVDAVAYVDDDDLGGFTIREGEAGAATTLTDASGVEYTVRVDDLDSGGVHTLQLTRT